MYTYSPQLPEQLELPFDDYPLFGWKPATNPYWQSQGAQYNFNDGDLQSMFRQAWNACTRDGNPRPTNTLRN